MSLPVLQTERLRLTLLQPGMERAMVDFLSTNAAHFSPWDPPAPPDLLSTERWAVQCSNAVADFQNGSAVRFLLAPAAQPEKIIGAANVTQIFRGPFQGGVLGYRIGREWEGQGLMREALAEIIRYLFDEQRLHRIHANYLPSNARSGRLLARLGFTIEGYAKDYLFIDGAWRDHVLTSLTHSGFDREWLLPGAVTPKR